jgi:catechol 2,3-dioxygenase-like lactoylglutathione lyase family enzyme
MTIKHIDHLNLSVTDLQASLAFYSRVFGFEPVEGGFQSGAPWAIVRSGDAMLALYESKQREHHDRFALRERRLHGMNHFALRITDRQAWLDTVEREGLDVSYGGVVEWLHSNSWYIVDPTGYEIEVVFWEQDQIDFRG